MIIIRLHGIDFVWTLKKNTMKRIIYFFIAGTIILSSCASTGKTDISREMRKELVKEDVKQTVESQKMMIRMNRIHLKRGGTMQIVPERNYIMIDGDLVRVNLAYIGRSYSIRPVAAINFLGKVYSREIEITKKGGYNISLEVGQGNEKFKIDMNISNEGYVNISVSNPMIDYIRYYGRLSSNNI